LASTPTPRSKNSSWPPTRKKTTHPQRGRTIKATKKARDSGGAERHFLYITDGPRAASGGINNPQQQGTKVHTRPTAPSSPAAITRKGAAFDSRRRELEKKRSGSYAQKVDRKQSNRPESKRGEKEKRGGWGEVERGGKGRRGGDKKGKKEGRREGGEEGKK